MYTIPVISTPFRNRGRNAMSYPGQSPGLDQIYGQQTIGGRPASFAGGLGSFPGAGSYPTPVSPQTTDAMATPPRISNATQRFQQGQQEKQNTADVIHQQRALDNYQANQATKAAGIMRQADYTQSRSQAMGAYPGAMASPSASAPIGPGLGAAPIMPQAPQQTPQPATARITLGTPGQLADNGPSNGQWANSEMTRERGLNALHGRGLGLPVQDGGAYQYQPRPLGTPGQAPAMQTFTGTFDAPATSSAGIPTADQANIDRNAAQYARGNALRTQADLQAGGYFSGNDLAQKQIDAQAQATLAKSQNETAKQATAADGSRVRGEAAMSQAQAANKRADAAMVGAQRPRQATPGTQTKGPTVSEMQAELKTALMEGDEQYAAHLREGIRSKMGFAPAGNAGGAAPTTQSSGAPTSQPAASANSASISREQAQQFLTQAGGDKEKARQLAAQAGFAF